VAPRDGEPDAVVVSREGTEIAEITTFGPQMFGLCGLPATLSD
jgi:hypothetical protein